MCTVIVCFTSSNHSELLAVIVILCNGDSDIIKKTSSVLTWYEEFFFFFELLYGTIHTWEDAESVKHGFGLDQKSLRKVFDTQSWKCGQQSL